jgi:hypothetical protein
MDLQAYISQSCTHGASEHRFIKFYRFRSRKVGPDPARSLATELDPIDLASTTVALVHHCRAHAARTRSVDLRPTRCAGAGRAPIKCASGHADGDRLLRPRSSTRRPTACRAVENASGDSAHQLVRWEQKPHPHAACARCGGYINLISATVASLACSLCSTYRT